MNYNKKTFKNQNKYNAKENGELRQSKHNKVNRNSYRYNDDYDEAQEILNSYVGNFRF
jgi:hypothetical protein